MYKLAWTLLPERAFPFCRTTLGQTASLKIVSFDIDNDVTMCHEHFGTAIGDIGNVPGVVVKQVKDECCVIVVCYATRHFLDKNAVLF